MRLNGRTAIMRYLGRNPKNKAAWRRIRARYSDVIRCFSGSGPVWARSEELDLVDIRECKTMTEVLAARGARGEAVGGAVGGYPLEYLKLMKRVLGPGAGGAG
ncbi:MAG: hypothetical protein HY713_12610 [candidate division NC10 bacterium]|nr:hypothetical protein [candidate division NC10 bacterium]